MVTLHGREVHPDDTLMYRIADATESSVAWKPVRAGDPDLRRGREPHISYISSFPKSRWYRWPDLRDYVKDAIKEQEKKP